MGLQPNAALTEMLAADGELDRILEGRGLTFTRPDPTATPTPAPPLRIPPPPWSENYVPPIDVEALEDTESRPASPKPKPPVPTPNLDTVKAWRELDGGRS
jgi:hypothetical protein